MREGAAGVRSVLRAGCPTNGLGSAGSRFHMRPIRLATVREGIGVTTEAGSAGQPLIVPEGWEPDAASHPPGEAARGGVVKDSHPLARALVGAIPLRGVHPNDLGGFLPATRQVDVGDLDVPCVSRVRKVDGRWVTEACWDRRHMCAGAPQAFDDGLESLIAARSATSSPGDRQSRPHGHYAALSAPPLLRPLSHRLNRA